MTRIRSFLLLLGLCALIDLIWPGPCAAADGCRAQGIDERVRVRWVIDGDTVVLADGRHLRFIGFNAPERAHDEAPAEPLGNAAWQALKARLPAGSALLLEFDRERHDRHGRLLAHAFLPNGSNLQALMLSNGLGLRLTIPPDLRHQACYRAAEKQARHSRLGVWSKLPALPLGIPGRDEIDGRFRLSRGRIVGIHRRHRAWTLRLDNGVMLRIGPRARERFSGGGLRRLRGVRVLARGYVYRYHGRWWMSVTHPDNLQPED